MAKMNEKTLTQKLNEVMKPYLAQFLVWYYSDPETRISWDSLCKQDMNFRDKNGKNKSQEFCEKTWLIREDVQRGMIIYLQHMKKFNFMQRYQEMSKKALKGDVNAAKYIDDLDKQLNKMSIDKNTQNEIDQLLQGVNIHAD